MARLREEPEWDEYKDVCIVDWKITRAAIEHENLLTNHRLTWLLASQGFLFAIYGLVLKEAVPALFAIENGSTTHPSVDMKALSALYMWVLLALSVTGILVCLHLSLGLKAAHEHHARLERWFKRRDHPRDRRPPLAGKNPRLLRRWDVPYWLFPFIFAIAWLILLLVPFLPYAPGFFGLLGPWLLGSLAVVVAGYLVWVVATKVERRRSKRAADRAAADDTQVE